MDLSGGSSGRRAVPSVAVIPSSEGPAPPPIDASAPRPRNSARGSFSSSIATAINGAGSNEEAWKSPRLSQNSTLSSRARRLSNKIFNADGARRSSVASTDCKSGPFAVVAKRLPQVAETPPASALALRVHAVLVFPMVQGFMVVLTVGVLYCGDFVQAVADVSFDRAVSALLYVCLICFSTEWVMNVIASRAQTPRYIGSLFFFLDFVATASIALDIIVLEANNLTDSGPVARAARTARIGTRAGRSLRLLRLMRFLRLVRVTRMVKALLAQRLKRSEDSGVGNEMQEEGPASDMQRANTIGAQIGAATTKKVIIMTLMLLTMISLLERNHEFQVCSGEFLYSVQALYRTPRIGANCTKMIAEVGPWFVENPGIVDFSQRLDSGLTQNGLMLAMVEGCILFSDSALIGDATDPEMEHLAARRRGTEVLAIPCDAKFKADADGDGGKGRSQTFFLYDMREESVEEAAYSMGFTTVIIAALLGFSILFSSDAEKLADQLVQPIRQLLKDMSHTATLELDKVTPPDKVVQSSVVEIRKLQYAFHSLNMAVRSFSKFTPLEVVRHFLSLGAVAQLGVSERNVSIFFSDIAGWTTICEATEPVDVLKLLSEYFESMVSIIIEEQGTMLEFIGDAILAIWNAPNDVPDHAVRSVTTALRMNKVLDDLRRACAKRGKPEINIRVGLHSARVFVGNLGSKMRMKYGVLGDGVNLASRLEEMNKRYGTESMISEDVLKEPGVAEAFVVRPVDIVVVKGRREPTRLYEVLGYRETATEDMLQFAELSEKAMHAYGSGDFSKAIEFLQGMELLKGGCDSAGKVLSDRCHAFLRQPPPPDWDGSETP